MTEGTFPVVPSLEEDSVEDASVSVGIRQDTKPVIIVSREDEEVVEIPLVVPMPGNNAVNGPGSGEGNNNGGIGGNESNDSDLPDDGDGDDSNLPGDGDGDNGDSPGTVSSSRNEVMAVADTDTIGSYLQELMEGDYRVILSKEGYVLSGS